MNNPLRIMIDANILISAIFFTNEKFDRLFQTIFDKHNLVISSYVINELIDVAQRKFPNRISVLDKVLANMPYELVYTPLELPPDLFEIRDPDDYPVLYTAITEDIDILITGDKDFSDIRIKRPILLTPAQFIKKYAN